MKDAILKNNIEYSPSDYHLVAIFFIRQTFLLQNRPQDESSRSRFSLDGSRARKRAKFERGINGTPLASTSILHLACT